MTKLSLIKKTYSILKKINMWGTLSNSTSPKIQYNTLVPFCKIREHRSIEQGLKDNLLSYKTLSKYKRAILMTSETKLLVDVSGFVEKDLGNKIYVMPENFIEGVMTNDKIYQMTIADKESIIWFLKVYGFTSFMLFVDPFRHGHITFENASLFLAHILKNHKYGLFAALPEKRNKNLEIEISSAREALLHAQGTKKIQAIENLKKLVKEYAHWKKTIQDTNPFSNIVTAMQHFFNVIPGNQKFDSSILKIYGDLYGISTEEFDGKLVSMQNVVELSFLILVAPFCNARGVSMHLRNHDISNKFKVQSYLDTKQENPDVMFILNFVERMLFYDFKSYTGNNIGIQTISAFQPCEAAFLKEINNIINSLHQFILDKEKRYEIEAIDNIRDLKNNLINIQKATDTLEEKYNKVLNKLCDAIFDPAGNFEDLKIGFTIPLKQHERFVVFYEQVLKNNIEKAAESPSVLEALKNLVPVNSQITKETHKTSHIEILKNIYPESSEDVIVRFLNFIEHGVLK